MVPCHTALLIVKRRRSDSLWLLSLASRTCWAGSGGWWRGLHRCDARFRGQLSVIRSIIVQPKGRGQRGLARQVHALKAVPDAGNYLGELAPGPVVRVIPPKTQKHLRHGFLASHVPGGIAGKTLSPVLMQVLCATVQAADEGVQG